MRSLSRSLLPVGMASLIMLLALVGHLAFMASPLHVVGHSVSRERAAATHRAPSQGAAALPADYGRLERPSGSAAYGGAAARQAQHVRSAHQQVEPLTGSAAPGNAAAAPVVQPAPLPDCSFVVAPAPRPAPGNGSLSQGELSSAPAAAAPACRRLPWGGVPAVPPSGPLRLHARLGQFLN